MSLTDARPPVPAAPDGDGPVGVASGALDAAATGAIAETVAGALGLVVGADVVVGYDPASRPLTDAVGARLSVAAPGDGRRAQLVLAVERQVREPSPDEWRSLAADAAAAAGLVLADGPPATGPVDELAADAVVAAAAGGVASARLERDAATVGLVLLAVELEPTAPELPAFDAGAAAGVPRPLASLAGVEMAVTVELGRTHLAVRDLLALQTGAVVQLDQPVGSPVDIFVNGTPIGRGEVVVVEGDYGVRVTHLVGGD